MISLNYKNKDIIKKDLKCKHIKRILPWINLRQKSCWVCEWEKIKLEPVFTPPSSPRLMDY